ncbi:hypothetical protein Q7P36_009210 [Cladosporium allicinum]
MSDWIGPNIYRIESYKDRKASIAVRDGTNVVIKTNTADQHDEENQWVFVHAGSGVSGKEEFLIINRKTGTHLTCAEGEKQAPLTVTKDSPTYFRCRWNIAPTRNGTGAYFIVPAKNNDMRLVTQGEATAENSKLQIWKGELGSKGTWWFLELMSSGELQSASLGKAPAP